MLVPIYKISWGHIPEDSIIVKILDSFKHWHIYCFIVIILLFPNNRKDGSAIATTYHFPFSYLSIRTIENL